MSIEPKSAAREVRFEYSLEFLRIIEHGNTALLISTYQAGRLVVVGSRQGQLTFAFRDFERLMGVAAQPQRVGQNCA